MDKLKYTIRNMWKKFTNIFGKKGQNFIVETSNLPYESLSPIADADKDGTYKEALDWALSKRKEKDIKNIALTGPYGSGKSSVLKTFMNKNEDESLKFLPISLATFQEEKQEQETKEEKREKETEERKQKGKETEVEKRLITLELLRQIEFSILQQIFYREEEHKIPDSRFIRIKTVNKTELFLYTLALGIFGGSFLYAFFPSLFNNPLGLEFNDNIKAVFHFLAFFFVISIGFGIIWKFAKSLINLRINKINIQNLELGADDNLNKSVLNDNIDEILYYFRQGGYNVVIFEDLDRFEQTEIFTKLREINLLINQSKSIEEHVVFIYAVRDDIFKENERTKFFDFIIPVIPIVNFSNSSEILVKKREKENYTFSKELIDDVSTFLGDMRLLSNITNEYHIYQKSLNPKLSPDQLFAILVYKNLYPSDFTNLANNQGNLYKHIYRKKEFVRDLIEKSDEQTQERKDKIEELEKEKLQNIEELRKLYVFSFLNWYLSKRDNFSHFLNNGTNMNLTEIVDEKFFSNFLNNRISSYYLISDRYSNKQKNRENEYYITEFGKENNNLSHFHERESKLKEISEGAINRLEKEIGNLRIQKEQAKRLSVAELIAEGEIEFGSTAQERLISVLLRNGYVTENYIDYISIFHEVSISRSDHEFLLNVKSQTDNNYELELEQAENLINKINALDFTRKYVFNFDLVNCLAKSNKDRNETKSINLFKKLSDESDESTEFVESYLNSEKTEPTFLSKLFGEWKSIWNYIQDKSKFTSERKEEYFQLILEHGTVESIQAIADNSNFGDFILSKKDFLHNQIGEQKIRKIIKSLHLHIKHIPEDVNDDMLRFIHEGGYHALSIDVVRLLCCRLDDTYYEYDFNNRNYSYIQNSKCSFLKKGIERNINAYVSNIFLKLGRFEREASNITLLNNSVLKSKYHEQIIVQMYYKVPDISDINNSTLRDALLVNNKVEPSWDNILFRYEEGENEDEYAIGSIDVEYLSRIENAKALASKKIKRDSEGEKRYTPFIKHILLNNAIDNEAYSLLVKSSPYWYPKLPIEELSEPKVKSLITNKTLRLSSSSFSAIPTSKLEILLVERNSEAFEKIDEYTLTASFVKLAIKSTVFSDEQKATIIEKYKSSNYSIEDLFSKILAEFVISNRDFLKSDDSLKGLVLSKNIDIETSLRLFIERHNEFDNDFTTEFIETLPEPYLEINNKRKRPIIPNTEVNRAFLNILESKGVFSSFTETGKGFKVWQNRQ